MAIDFGIIKADPIGATTCTDGSGWNLTGGGAGGYDALQIYDMTGQINPPSGDAAGYTDLYFGTQDNHVWASPDGGVTWPTSWASEGLFLQAAHTAGAGDNALTFTVCGAPCNSVRAPRMDTGNDGNAPPPWPTHSPPGNSGWDAPFIIEPNVYVQWSGNTLYMTTDDDATPWTAVADLPSAATAHHAWPQIYGTSQPVIYEAVDLNNAQRGLVQITGTRVNGAPAAGTAKVEPGLGLNSLGLYCRGWNIAAGCRGVFAVDPSNAAHLIAADAGSGQMVISNDSGNTWAPDSKLTDLVTDGGNLSFSDQAHVISFDPTNPNLVLIGTQQSGLLESIDGGNTWSRMGNSRMATDISGFFFDEQQGFVYVSTYGRGIWRLSPPTYVVTKSFQAGANAQSFEADCYPGDFATGGGFEIPSGVVKEPAASRPNVDNGEPTGWIARFGIGVGGTVKVFADCMAPASGAGGSVSSYVVVAARVIGATAGSVTAFCKGSDSATGGGFATAGLKVVRESKPNAASGTASGWTSFFGISLDFGGVTVRSFVVCASGPGISTNVASSSASFGVNAGGVSVACPSGDAAVGGGFSFTGGTKVPLISRPDAAGGLASGWFAFFGIGIGGTGTAFVVCFTRGTSASVVCSPSAALVGVATSCTATVSNLDTSSTVTPTGSVAFSSDKSGFFTPAQICTLAGSGSTASCSVQFTPSAGSVGAIALTAIYGGDSNHGGSTGSFGLEAFDFIVAVSATKPTVLRGGSTSYSVTTSLIAGSLGAPTYVGLAVSGLPADASFGSATLTLPGTSTVMIHTGTASLGDFALTISGTLPGGFRSAASNLHIYDFSVATTPSSLHILPTGSNVYSVSVQLVPGSSIVGLPTIGLSVSGLPSGTTGMFNPIIGTPNFVSVLTITTAAVVKGSYTITVSGTDGRIPQGGTRSTNPTLAVLSPVQGLQQLMNEVSDLHTAGVLSQGQANSLLVKLNHAVDNLDNRPDKKTACNQLSAFANEVNAYVSAGILTPAEADALLAPPLGVLAIMAAIPC